MYRILKKVNYRRGKRFLILCNTLSISEIEKLYSNIDNYSPVFSREHKAYEHELLKEEI